jgi:hypothetical protein
MKGLLTSHKIAEPKDDIIKRPFFNYVEQEFKDVDAFFDYLEALLGTSTFPRSMMTKTTHGQVLVSSRKVLLEKLEDAKFQDCFIATHSELDKATYTLRTIFLDYDNSQDIVGAISDAVQVASEFEKEFNVKPHVQFSGSKGAHVIVPTEPLGFEEPQEEKGFLSFVQRRYSKESLDKQIIGDASRLVRVPFTINTKALETPWKGHVKILQTWNGKYADITKLLQIFKIKGAIEETIKSEKPSFVVSKKHVRKEVQELIKRAEEGIYLTHNQRLAIATELINNGFPNEQIVNIFRKQEDFSENYTIYQINWLRKNHYKPFTTERLREILKEAD